MLWRLSLQILGGGPTMSAWHLNTLTPTVTFDTPGVAQNVALFYEDKVRESEDFYPKLRMGNIFKLAISKFSLTHQLQLL